MPPRKRGVDGRVSHNACGDPCTKCGAPAATHRERRAEGDSKELRALMDVLRDTVLGVGPLYEGREG